VVELRQRRKVAVGWVIGRVPPGSPRLAIAVDADGASRLAWPRLDP
jgi:hypothetical protein